MVAFGEYVAWENYLSTKVAECEGVEESLERVLAATEARALKDAAGKITDKRIDRDADPAVIKARDAVGSAKQERKGFIVLRDNVSRTSAFVSRELTRRVGREPYDRRDRTFGGR